MMTNKSSASSDADSSTFGHPEESEDPEFVTRLCENHEKGVLRLLESSVVVDTTEDKETRSRPLLRLAFGILLLAIGLLLDARRIVDAASLIMP